MTDVVAVSAAVEGLVDEAVVRRLVAHAGGVLGPVYGKNGKPALRRHVSGYNKAAHRTPWVVLVDLNGEQDCAPPLRRAWVPDLAPHLCFRVAVRAVEAWLMADRGSLAGFLRIPEPRVPLQPEVLPDPKRTLVDLARRSRLREIREDMVPRERSGRAVGPAYTSRIIEYIERGWRPDVAARHADSLRRGIACLERLVANSRGEGANAIARHDGRALA